jgi:hypothetical protein
MNDNKIYNSVYDFCRCSQVGDMFKMTHKHKGCRYDNREFIAIREEHNQFKIIMDSAEGRYNGKTLIRGLFNGPYKFQKLDNNNE